MRMDALWENNRCKKSLFPAALVVAGVELA